MGCLPLPIFLLLGCGIGWLAGEKSGAVYGSVIGLAIGLVLTFLLFRAMRRGNREP
jgi:tetrahydromethanopterin S-methyltransferase subunit B